MKYRASSARRRLPTPDLVLERLHQPGLRLCMAHERVLLADSLEEGLLHGLFGVGGIEKEVLGVDIQPFIICIVQRFQKGIGLHALHQPLCGRMAAGIGLCVGSAPHGSGA